MPDNERELSLRATVDATQAKPELAELKRGVDDVTSGETKLGGAATDAKHALDGQVPTLEELLARTKNLGAETKALGANLEGTASSSSTAKAAFTAFGLSLEPLLLAAVAVGVALYKAGDAGTWLGEKYNELAGVVPKETEALSENEKATIKAEQAAKKLADTKDQQARFQALVNLGLAENTQQAALNTAQLLAHEAALHGTVDVTDQYRQAMKALGITIEESADVGLAKQRIFLDEYERRVKTQGVAAADEFAKAHKNVVAAILETANETGKIIPKFAELTDRLHLVSKEYAEQDAAILKVKDKIASLTAELDKHAAKLAEHTAAIERHRVDQERASDSEYSHVRKNLDLEIADLEAARRAGVITEEKYRDELARIQTEEVNARRAHEAEIDAIDAAAAQKTKEAQEKEATEVAGIVTKLEAEKQVYTDLDLERKRVHDADMNRRKVAAADLDTHLAELETKTATLTAKLDAVNEAAAINAAKAAASFVGLAGAIQGAVEKVNELVGAIAKLDPDSLPGPGA